MNEHIKKLADQCTEVLWRDGPYEREEFNKEKFAELLICECVGVADDYVKDCTCDEHINCKHPQSAIGRKIREHFGVER